MWDVYSEIYAHYIGYYITLYETAEFSLQRNVKDIMDANGVRILVDLLTLAHLHTSRATVPMQVGCNLF